MRTALAVVFALGIALSGIPLAWSYDGPAAHKAYAELFNRHAPPHLRYEFRDVPANDNLYVQVRSLVDEFAKDERNKKETIKYWTDLVERKNEPSAESLAALREFLASKKNLLSSFEALGKAKQCQAVPIKEDTPHLGGTLDLRKLAMLEVNVLIRDGQKDSAFKKALVVTQVGARLLDCGAHAIDTMIALAIVGAPIDMVDWLDKRGEKLSQDQRSALLEVFNSVKKVSALDLYRRILAGEAIWGFHLFWKDLILKKELEPKDVVARLVLDDKMYDQVTEAFNRAMAKHPKPMNWTGLALNVANHYSALSDKKALERTGYEKALDKRQLAVAKELYKAFDLKDLGVKSANELTDQKNVNELLKKINQMPESEQAKIAERILRLENPARAFHEAHLAGFISGGISGIGKKTEERLARLRAFVAKVEAAK